MKPTGFTANYMFILSWDSLIHLQLPETFVCWKLSGRKQKKNANRVHASVHSEDLNKTISLSRKQRFTTANGQIFKKNLHIRAMLGFYYSF